MLPDQMSKESIPQFARRRFQTDAFLERMPGNIVTIAIKLQIMLASQIRDESLIRIRLRPAQPVIEMNDGKDNPQLTPQLHEQPQKRHRINPAGNSHTHAIPGPQQLLPPDMGEHALGESVHGHNGTAGCSREREE